MKTRLLLSLVAVALAFLSAEIARAGTKGDECPKERGGRLQSARQKCH